MRAHRSTLRLDTHGRRSRKLAIQRAARLKPIALAVLMGLGAAGVQAADLRVPVPAVDGVFVSRGVGRITSSASELAAGRLVVGQDSNRAIYRWESFDIGRDASVTFNMPGSTSSALNRVVGTDLRPSEILGKLTSNGNVYIINRNGIVFGANAQVNVGGLVASTLEVGDDDFMSGLVSSITGSAPTFQWQDVTKTVKDADGKDVTVTLATYDHENNYVKVEQGAEISTSSGGRVFLVARDVTNEGHLSSPDGQVVLAGGEKVYLADPTNEPTYAIESNAAIPSTRGLLVEVSGLRGTATNGQHGLIETARGNTTIVGMAVNQRGRIKATTSVNANGSVFLLASGAAEVTSVINPSTNEVTYHKQATQGGALTLGEGSNITISADTALSADGTVPVADSNSTFKNSRIELSGKTIELQKNASIVAPGATVNVRAQDKPSYGFNVAGSDPVTQGTLLDGESGQARVTLAEGAKIDVSGTTTAQVSVARNFVTTELLGANDLKDAPLQKDGPIYRSKLTIDVREGSNILSDDSLGSLRKGLLSTVDERLATGGNVNITSTGAVVTHQSSTIDVSGGKVEYTADKVNPSVLVAANGQRYTLNNAPKDTRYVAIEGAVTTSPRPGVSGSVVGDAQQGRTEAGYTEGRDAGAITIVAPKPVLDGSLRGQTFAGQRQLLGKDALAKAGRLTIGSRISGGDGGAFGSTNFVSAVTRNLLVTASGQSLDASFWIDPDNANVDSEGRVSAAMLNGSGFGTLTFTSDGGITLADGANLQLANGSTVDWAARGAAGITIGGDIRSSGGTVALRTSEIGISHKLPEASGQGYGTITLKAGKQIDVSGNWVNQVSDGQASAAALKGGSVTLASSHGIDLQAGSGIDVSGGATLLRTTGAVTGSNAGSIKVTANGAYQGGQAPLDRVNLQSTFQGYSLAKGGSLSLFAGGDVDIHAPNGAAALKSLDQAGLSLSTDFFNQGGFTTFNVGAFDHLNVLSGAQLVPTPASWRVATNSNVRGVASGAHAAAVMQTVVLPAAQRSAVQLTLSAAGVPAQTKHDGELTIEQGATVDAGARGSVTLNGGSKLVVDGAVKAAGGVVAMTLLKNDGTEAGFKGELRLGSHANVDVSGAALIKPATNGLQQGSVLNGGTISIDLGGTAKQTTIEVQEGAKLNADGGVGQLDVANAAGAYGTTYVRQTVASSGGTITINAAQGGAVLAGDMHAKGGNGTALGGAINVNATGSDVHVQQGALTAAQKDVDAAAGTVTVSAAQLSANFADVSLQSSGRIQFDGDSSLAARRQLTLDAPVIAASDGATVKLEGTSVARMGNGNASVLDKNPTGGSATLNLKGGLVELFGQQSLQGVNAFNATATDQLRLSSATVGVASGLATAADVTLKAPQVVVSSGANYTIDAADHQVKFTGGDASAAKPLSVGGALTVNAARIVQEGVLRAPFGQITFNATEKIDLTPGSVTSVSGNGITAPYGVTTGGGAKWTIDGSSELNLAGKEITLSAPGQNVTVASGATVDLSGGGNVLAYEFVPGSGGSADIFTGSDGAFAVVPTLTGYAPQDLLNAAASGIKLGQQITFGAGGPLPAGTYAVLPARYALLPGAFLVKSVAVTGNVSAKLGTSVTRPDGAQIVGGQMGYAGVSSLQTMPSNYLVMTGAQARRYSEIRETNLNTYLTTKAAAADQAVPRRPIDAGAFTLNAGSAQLAGQTLFNVPTGGRGGEFNVASDRILVSDTASGDAGVLTLSAAQLNALGAQSILLGGTRGEATDATTADRSVTVTASEVTIDASSQPLRGNDIILAANGQVTINSSASIVANDAVSGTAETLGFSGDGALLRVSSDSTARSVRTGATGSTGVLNVGENATLQGGAITAEATQSTQIASTATLKAASLTIGAGQVAAGAVSTSDVAAGTLVLSPTLLTQLSHAANVTLRSFGSIDFYGQSTLGSNTQQALTIDTSQIRLVGADAQASLQAGGVTLTNTTGVVPVAVEAGAGQFKVQATGTAGGSGNITLGAGSSSVSGVQSTTLTAAHNVVFDKGSSAFASSGSTTINANSLTAKTGAQASMSTTDAWVLNSPAAAAATSTASAGVGAHVAVTAGTIEQAGTIALTSGELKLTSTSTGLGDSGTQGVRFANGSLTDLSGQGKTFDGVAVYTAGGALTAQALTGDVGVARGATINVSAPSGGGSAGSVKLLATQGAVVIDGRLVGTSQSGKTGGSLQIDSKQAVDLGKLAQTLAAEQTTTLNNFRQSLVLRNRSGDQTVEAGTTLQAKSIEIDADAGKLSVAGTLSASGDQGGTLTLASAGKLTLQSGALLANATGSNQNGGQINLQSSNAAVNGASSGGIELQAGARIETQATGTGSAGKLNLRSARNAAGTDVLVDPIQSTLVGVGQVEVEAVKTYTATAVNSALISTINTDNAKLAGANNANVAAIKNRLAGSNTALVGVLDVRSGAEVRSTGDLTVSTAWDMTRNGTAAATLVDGKPTNVTLRAAGNLNVQASLSDGFATAAPNAAITGNGGTIRLVGGADISAANVMSTVASDTKGDVVIGKASTDVVVRTTTGDVQIAAGRDVQLLNRQAVVYTTGKPVDTSTLKGYTAASNNYYLASGSTVQSPFLTDGGRVVVQAQRDVKQSATTAAQNGVEWWWRQASLSPTLSPSWFNRYDQFKQGFATFGGGDAVVRAGRDAVGVEVAAAGSGYIASDTTSTAFGGGSVNLQAGRDVVGGFVFATGGEDIDVSAGRDLAAASNGGGLQVFYGQGDTTLTARNALVVGRVASAGLIRAVKQGALTSGTNLNAIYGLSPDATLTVQAEAGDLAYLATNSQGSSGGETLATVLPAQTTMAAPNGQAAIGKVNQMPAGEATLNLVAQGNLALSGVGVTGSMAAQAQPVLGKMSDLLPQFTTGSIGYTQTPTDEAGQKAALQPVRIVSASGSVVTDTNIVQVAKPLRVIAGQDITTAGGFASQHQSATDVSLIEAGRDIVINSAATGITVHGAGELVVDAGRNISLGTSTGILAKGNRENVLLPDGSARVTVLAGVDLSGAVYESAKQWAEPLLKSSYAPSLIDFMAQRMGQTPATADEALTAFQALPKEQQLLLINQVLVGEVRAAGRQAAALDGAERDAAYAKAYAAIQAVFQNGAPTGNVDMGASAIKTVQGSDVLVLVPHGGLNVGQLTNDDASKSSANLGLVTSGGGGISVLVRDDVTVNQSRVFTVGKGDLLIWSSNGNIDAGKGAKTVTGAPAPVYRLDSNGNLQVDTSGSFSGSGIAVLDTDSALDLYAPKGEINAGDAGIKSKGSTFLGAQRFVGADNLSLAGPTVGAPKAPTMDAIPVTSPRINTDSPRAGNEADEDQVKKKKKRKLLVDFLGVGDGT